MHLRGNKSQILSEIYKSLCVSGLVGPFRPRLVLLCPSDSPCPRYSVLRRPLCHLQTARPGLTPGLWTRCSLLPERCPCRCGLISFSHLIYASAQIPLHRKDCFLSILSKIVFFFLSNNLFPFPHFPPYLNIKIHSAFVFPSLE